MNISQQTKERFRVDESLIKKYNYWSVLFRFDQVTPGSMIVIANSGKKQLGDLTTDEWSEFSQVSHDIETTLRNIFGAEKFNYLALMMYDPEVHFHVIPRYAAPVVVAGVEVVDQDWPEKTEMKVQAFSQEQTSEIIQKLRSALA